MASISPRFRHQALCILNELQAARSLATRLNKDPDLIVDPYLQELIKLCRNEAAMEELRDASAAISTEA